MTTLLDSLMKLDLMIDRANRDHVRSQLGKVLGPKFGPDTSKIDRLDALHITQAALDAFGERELLKVLRLLGATEGELAPAAELIYKMLPLSILDILERSALADLLHRVSPAALGKALSIADLSEAGLLPEPANGAVAALRQIARERQVTDPLAWHFLESVAHSLEEQNLFLELHLLIHGWARNLGLEQIVLEICKRSRERPDDPGETSSKSDDKLPNDLKSKPGAGDVNAPTKLDGQSKAAIVPVIYGGVPPQNIFFSGRDDVLENLSGMLNADTPTAVLPHTLGGLGGIGKTQVAVEYTHRQKSDYDLVWWIPAEDELSIRRSYSSLANRLGLRETPDVQNTIETVIDQLRVGQPYYRWLLVFDNATEPNVVKKYLPAGPGHVLITSRSSSWKLHSTVLEVDVFDDSEAIAFLQKRWPGMSDADALRLAEKLGSLPLALDQAAAVHQQTGMPLDEYLRLLEKNPYRVLKETPPTDYPESVANTFGLAFQKLSERNMAAAQLLQVCAFLSSNPIWVPLLWHGRGAHGLPAPLDETLRDEFSIRSAVRDIGRYALAQLDESRDFIKVHPLVRAVLRDGLPTEERSAIEQWAHRILAFANPGYPDKGETWSLHKHIAPHVQAAGAMFSADHHVQQVILDQVRFQFAVGDYQASRTLAAAAVEDWKSRLGPADKMTLLASLNLGNALRLLGEYEAARTITEQTAAKMPETFGEGHEYTLRAFNNVTADLRLTGDFGAACEKDEESLKQHRDTLGANDTVTLRAANNLAVDYRLLGRFGKARELDEDTLQRRSAVLGPENPETLSSINSLVRDLFGLGEYESAQTLQMAQLPSFVDKLGASHRFVLVAQRNRAVIARKQGKYPEALRLAERTLGQTLHKFGPVHEYTLAAMMTLANTQRALGDFGSASALAEEALQHYRARFRPNHPFTSACMVNLAIIYRSVGKFQQAIELDEEALPALAATLGPEHPYTLSCTANTTNDLALAGRIVEARQLSEQVVERSKRGRVPDHPYTMLCEANLALDLIATGGHDEGIELLDQVVQQMQLRLGPQHPETVNVAGRRRAETDIEVPPM